MELSPTECWRDGAVELFLLRPESVSDAYIDWLNDPQVNRYLESRFVVQERLSVEQFVGSMLASDANLFLGIRDRALDRHVGNIKLGPIDRRHGLGEIGLMIGDRAVWGRGIASRAIALVAGIAADQLKLRKLTAGCYASNEGSKRAFLKAGFQVEATRPDHFLLDGQPEGLILMSRFLQET